MVTLMMLEKKLVCLMQLVCHLTIGSINFTVPATGAFGATRMRVVSQDVILTSTNSIGPCDYSDPSISNAQDVPWFGATEDYSIVLNSPVVNATFLWDNGQTTSSVDNLSPGTYTVTITPNSSGCAVQDSATISEPDEITFSPTITPISCNSFYRWTNIIKSFRR